jgi:hypothetical protein
MFTYENECDLIKVRKAFRPVRERNEALFITWLTSNDVKICLSTIDGCELPKRTIHSLEYKNYLDN